MLHFNKINNSEIIIYIYKKKKDMLFDLLYVKGLKGEEMNLLQDYQIQDRKKILNKIVS